MSNDFYQDLHLSLTQALAIAKGEMSPARVFTHEVEIPDVQAIRKKTGLSQVEFANKLKISFKTLQNWEQGRRKPTGTAIVLMNLIDKDPNILNLT
ncbi:NadS family protein [Moraxella sp. ZY210820]|uniref:NadS family protein n=1 Tax=unclassified Moraxella TaxID=2685852 RepID=UPI0027304DAD|nr:NadS family protein [Moraxella sp. ZY210820]WLF84284.1 helix-turn-helix domain-containing protein [Moraxella sp. ZY210820]